MSKELIHRCHTYAPPFEDLDKDCPKTDQSFRISQLQLGAKHYKQLMLSNLVVYSLVAL